MAMIARMGRILNWERSLWGAEDARGGGEDLGALLEDRRCAIEDRTGWVGVKAGLEKTPDAKRRAIGRDMRCVVQIVRCDEEKEGAGRGLVADPYRKFGTMGAPSLGI